MPSRRLALSTLTQNNLYSCAASHCWRQPPRRQHPACAEIATFQSTVKSIFSVTFRCEAPANIQSTCSSAHPGPTLCCRVSTMVQQHLRLLFNSLACRHRTLLEWFLLQYGARAIF